MKQILQDDRKLRRYRRRWKIKRTIGWLFNLRPLAIRYERKISVFSGFVRFACLMIALRQL